MRNNWSPRSQNQGHCPTSTDSWQSALLWIYMICQLNEPSTKSTEYSIQNYKAFNPLPDDKFQTLPNWKTLQTTIQKWKWQKVNQKSRKHCGKRRNCSLRAISSFPTVFSKSLFSQGRQKVSFCGNGLKLLNEWEKNTNNEFFCCV